MRLLAGKALLNLPVRLEGSSCGVQCALHYVDCLVPELRGGAGWERIGSLH